MRGGGEEWGYMIYVSISLSMCIYMCIYIYTRMYIHTHISHQGNAFGLQALADHPGNLCSEELLSKAGVARNSFSGRSRV